jgi:putative RecB family exonuclease
MTELLAPEYLSPSSISTFQQCPLKFKFSRIDKLTEPPTEATLVGNFVHDVLEDLYKEPQEHRSMSKAKQLARHQWNEKWAAEMASWIPEKKMHEARWKAWWCVENLWELEDPSSFNPAGLEDELDVAIAGVRVRGFIDRWSYRDNGSVIVSDYKTGKTPKPRYADDKYFQLLIYAVAIEEMAKIAGDNKVVEEIELLFLKDATRLRKEVTDTDRNSVKDVLVSVRSAIDARCVAGEFEATPNRLCDWCHYKPICPYWKK